MLAGGRMSPIAIGGQQPRRSRPALGGTDEAQGKASGMT